ncbi:MAG TPA: TIGR03032 family protein [Lacipirellulaceae bacterium]|nr:TIGR03032 family protein [Lacipirellulaceae bacterium]
MPTPKRRGHATQISRRMLTDGTFDDNEIGTAGEAAPSPLRSVHTTSFPAILDQLQSSLAVTTYQAGKLVILRSDGGVINTHFRAFSKPMGLAVGHNRLAIGTAVDVWEFRNVPAVAAKLEPTGKQDACFLPRSAHVTGDVQIHEMAYVSRESRVECREPDFKARESRVESRGPESDALGDAKFERESLWFVNTRFSCLATHDPDHSFAPVWRPKFISQLTPDDRCHLNGLCVVDGRPRWVTALGETDTPGGWRENKKSGGILIDVDSHENVARNLSMPHSPRWHAGRLWLLESGTGSLGFVDLGSGKYEPIVHLEGFTRGLEMIGNLAFVGLSQVRETAIFSGVQITERLKESERTCGVWVIDIQRGQVVAFLKFEEAVQEIFAVALLPGMRFPDLINDNAELVGGAFVLPDDALRDVPAELRATS